MPILVCVAMYAYRQADLWVLLRPTSCIQELKATTRLMKYVHPVSFVK